VAIGNEHTGQVQENLIAYHRLFANLPGIRFVEEEIVYIACQGLPEPKVMRTNFTDGEISRRVERALARIGKTTKSIDWLVFPSCQPADLGKQLIKHAKAAADGWRLVGEIGGTGGIWMLAELTSLSDGPSVSPNIRVIRVRNEAQLKEWERINLKGFSSNDYQVLYNAFSRQGLGPDSSALHYIGYLNDQPVTSATLFLAGGIAGVYNVSTPEVFRRQGFGSAITHAALEDAIQRGYRTAFLQSSSLGKGVYSDLGFVTTDFGIREYVWRKR
jgi:predicted GNAT family acetyltransferase